MAGWVVAACVVCQFWMGPARFVFQTLTTASAAQETASVRRDFIGAIAPDASVIAGLPYLSHLAMRQNLHSLHHVLKGLKTLSRAEYVPPPPTDEVLVDVADSATFDPDAGYYHPAMKTVDGRIIPESEQLLESFLRNASWGPHARNEVTLFRREAKPPQRPGITGVGRPLDDHHRLVSARLVTTAEGEKAVAFGYEVEPDRKIIPWVRLYLIAPDQQRYSITKGPIALGKPAGHAIGESWAIRPPSYIPKGKYQAWLLFYDNHEELFPGKARFEKRTFDLGEFEVR